MGTNTSLSPSINLRQITGDNLVKFFIIRRLPLIHGHYLCVTPLEALLPNPTCAPLGMREPHDKTKLASQHPTYYPATFNVTKVSGVHSVDNVHRQEMPPSLLTADKGQTSCSGQIVGGRD